MAVIMATVPMVTVAALFFKARPFVAMAGAVTWAVRRNIRNGGITRGKAIGVAVLVVAHIGDRATCAVIRSLLCHDPAVRRMAGRLTCCHTDGGTQCATHDGTLATAHVLAQHCPSRCTDTTTKQDTKIVSMRRRTQGRQGQDGASDQRRRGGAG